MVDLPIEELPVDPTVAWVFPGQGAQHVGMGADLIDISDDARSVFSQADSALNMPISNLCFEGPEEELSRTINTQPAIVTHSIAALAAALETGWLSRRPSVVAGHSLGEYAALIVAGAIGFNDGLNLVRTRGDLMQKACDIEQGSMTAVLGLDEETIIPISKEHGVSICNVNAPGNITIGGPMASVVAAAEAATRSGATKVVPLTVSGAFHTPMMFTAAEGLAEILQDVEFQTPTTPIISNVTAKPIDNPSNFNDELVKQVTSAVRWADSIEEMQKAGITTLIEFGPGRVLSGLTRRINRELITMNIGAASDLKNDTAEEGRK